MEKDGFWKEEKDRDKSVAPRVAAAGSRWMHCLCGSELQ